MKQQTKQIFRIALACAVMIGATWLPAHAAQQLALKYDDRYLFSSEVSSVHTEQITSYQAWTADYDTDVLKIDGENPNKVIAVGCGTANVELKNGTTIHVTVSAAPISLFLIVGQSNAEGIPNDRTNLATYRSQTFLCPEGQVYSTYAPATEGHYETVGGFDKTGSALSVENAYTFVPQTLTDNGSIQPWKRTNNLTDAQDAAGKLGFDGALAYQWNKQTGEKVWVVNAGHSATSIKNWAPEDSDRNNEFWQAVALYYAAERTLNREIAAGHYILSHKGYYWLQGEANTYMSTQTYLSLFGKIHQGFERELNGSGFKYLRKDLDFGGILMVRAHQTGTQDLTMTGARIAQFYMCASRDPIFSNVYMASNAEEFWVTNSGVKNYFIEKYGTQKNYANNNPLRCGSATMPATMSKVNNSLHYKQLGYNEIGLDAADNICYALGYARAPRASATIRAVSSDGYTPLTNTALQGEKGQAILAVAKVFPAYQTKNLQITKVGDMDYAYYALKYQKSGSTGTLKFQVGAAKKQYTLTCKPSTPQLLSVSGASKGITIKWKQQSDAVKYKVYRKTASVGWRCIATVSSAAQYMDKTAVLGTAYAYTVRAVSSTGVLSNYHTGLNGKLAVTLRSAATISNGIRIQWDKITNAAGYKIYRRNVNGEWRLIGSASATASNYTDTKTTKNKKYVYTVRAYNKKGVLSDYELAGIAGMWLGK